MEKTRTKFDTVSLLEQNSEQRTKKLEIFSIG
jgi:hypothetical protein